MIKIILIILGSIVGLFVVFGICEFILFLVSTLLFARTMQDAGRELIKRNEEFWKTHEKEYIQEEKILNIEEYLRIKNKVRIINEEVIRNWDSDKEFIKVTYEYSIIKRKGQKEIEIHKRS